MKLFRDLVDAIGQTGLTIWEDAPLPEGRWTIGYSYVDSWAAMRLTVTYESNDQAYVYQSSHFITEVLLTEIGRDLLPQLIMDNVEKMTTAIIMKYLSEPDSPGVLTGGRDELT